jgi:alanine-synthesizing transaminase
LIFSNRTPDDLSPNKIFDAVENASTEKSWDLTQTNPTLCGFNYPADLLEGLNGKSSYVYDPHPFGGQKAREAVAAYLNTKGEAAEPENIVLTASTSEAYSYLFKLFGNPGDSFLVPTPGYPLLDHLGALEGVELIPYALNPQPDWPMDIDALAKQIKPNTKGFLTINPHNPTGTSLSATDQNKMTGLCQKHDLVAISDEVFRDYFYTPETSPAWVPENVLSFRLGGLSKSLGLPQLKLAWMLLQGPSKSVAACKQRLELIADTYLSVNTPVQTILPQLFSFAPAIQKQILDRIHSNRDFLSQVLSRVSKAKLWPSHGGWVALIELFQKSKNDESLALDLFQKKRVLVHPGGFYDFPSDRCFWVLSLLSQPEIFEAGALRLEKYLSENL